MNGKPRRFFFSYQPDLPGIADPKVWPPTIATVLVLGLVLSIPVVSRFTGIAPSRVWWILGAWTAWSTCTSFVLSRYIHEVPWVFFLAIHGNLIAGLTSAARQTNGPCVAGPKRGHNIRTAIQPRRA